MLLALEAEFFGLQSTTFFENRPMMVKVDKLESNYLKSPDGQCNSIRFATAVKQGGVCFLTPKIFEPGRRQFGVPDRVLNVFVAEVGLQRPCLVTLVGQCVTAGEITLAAMDVVLPQARSRTRDHLALPRRS